MKQRTKQCVEWMGRLAGLRDFIETAELDRMKVMAEEHPEMFYHILPYASVLGVSDIFQRNWMPLLCRRRNGMCHIPDIRCSIII